MYQLFTKYIRFPWRDKSFVNAFCFFFLRETSVRWLYSKYKTTFSRHENLENLLTAEFYTRVATATETNLLILMTHNFIWKKWVILLFCFFSFFNANFECIFLVFKRREALWSWFHMSVCLFMCVCVCSFGFSSSYKMSCQNNTISVQCIVCIWYIRRLRNVAY